MYKKVLGKKKYVQKVVGELRHQTHFYEKIENLFPTAVAEFKMSRLTLPQRKFVIEFIMKHDVQVKIVQFYSL